MKGFRIALCGPLLLLASALTGSTAEAAEEIGLGLAYDPRAPVGNFREVVPNAGYGGLQARWDYFLLDELSVGFDVQYNNFRRGTPPDSAAARNGGPTAPTYRNVSFWSFLHTMRCYFSTSALRPYAEIGTGVSSASGALRLDDLTKREAVAAFIIQPSIGVLVKLTDDGHVSTSSEDDDLTVPGVDIRRRPRESMFGVTMSFTYAFTTADVAGAQNVSYAGFQLGIYAKP